ncbi:HAD hydrolase-like protein [Neobacillus muris]|uniref:HAD hydrolase-like protein n=1 Tax=Neobacillus muris TaxID=2941334 RepID=UPI0020416AC8|nr:HAD hydrolase-like protein [Neobacillus muris]
MHYNIIDFDQTLFNTREALLGVYQEAFTKYGYELRIDDFRKYEGESIDGLLEHYNVLNEHRILIKSYKKSEYKRFFKYIIPNYSLLNLTNKIIVSNAHSKDILDILNYYKINDVLEVIGRDKITLLKPNPECYISTMMKYGLENSYTIYEDSDSGMAAAKKAIRFLKNNQRANIIHIYLKTNILKGGSGEKVRLQENIVDKVSCSNFGLVEMRKAGIKTPNIIFYNEEKIIMEYINGTTLYSKYNHEIHSKKLINLIENIKSIPQKKSYDFDTYIERVLYHKLQFEYEKELVDIFDRAIDLLRSNIEFFSSNKSYCHGDLTLNNIVVKSNDFYLIDPNNSKRMYSSWLLDVSKLMQSSRNYEFIFGLSYKNNKVQVGKIRELIFLRYHKIYGKLLLLELTHWLRMLKYKQKNNEHFKQCKNICIEIIKEMDLYDHNNRHEELKVD